VPFGTLGLTLRQNNYVPAVKEGYELTEKLPGGPTAAVIAFQNPNIRVTVVDKDAGRIRKWNSQHPPIQEPGLNEIVRVARDGTNATKVTVDGASTVELPARQQNLFFSTDVAKCVSEADIVFLSVNTPTKMTGIGAGAATNMVALEGATRDIAIAAKPGAIIVEKSTVPCRTAQIVRDTVSPHLSSSIHILSKFQREHFYHNPIK
jgi:UDPglucose 6-dehydrogenase